MSDSRLQEIMTRAVVGRAEQTLTWCHKLAASGMQQVLGVRVGKVTVGVEMEEGRPLAQLTADCDLWCSDGEETKVLHSRCRTVHEVPVSPRGEVLGDLQSQIQLVSGPRSTGVRVEGEWIYIDFEATVQVEMIALARLWVKAFEMDLSPVTGEEWDSSGDSASPYGSH
ncbi:MAG: hypothetical protein ACOY93_21290 [Bacillota bacterium]